MPGKGKSVVFVINLLQDVSVLRGLVYLTARETDASISFLVSDAFVRRDGRRLWQGEVAAMAAETRAAMYLFGTASEAQAALEGGSGIIFAASESDLSAHRETADVFNIAPPDYLRVTLQHGLECVGFVQSREHSIRHGRDVGFGADVLCAWFEEASLTALIASQRAKLYVSGPPSLLQQRGRHPDHPATEGGLICENLHSVRLSASGDHRASFMDIFPAFCGKLAERREPVTLRPHPGGQYFLKNKIDLPDNVLVNALPIFHVDLASYRYGISPPSTVVLDMVLAGLPVAVWRDPAGVMDARNYEGLTEVRTLDEWLAFERDAVLHRDAILERQDGFLRRLGMLTEPAEVYRRFARLIIAGLEGTPSAHPPSRDALADYVATLEARSSGAKSRRPMRRASLSGNQLVATA